MKTQIMSKALKTFAIATVLLAGSSQFALAAKAAPAPAAPATGGGVNGIGVANPEAIVQNSAAFKTAQAQRPVTYKAQYDQAEARRQQIIAQLQPLVEKYKKDAAGGNTPAVQQQAQAIQQIQDSANQEFQKILAPVALSEAYVAEQINEKLITAIQTAMGKSGVTLLINPQSVISASNAYNLNQAILTELNTALPSAQLVPPAGWEPREAREAKAAQAARGTAAPANGR